ncbi:MAG TPA: CRTAC1 family protein [Vicinamibacteria bacterium]
MPEARARRKHRFVPAALAYGALAMAALGAAEAPGVTAPVAASTREMAALLEQSAALVDPMALSLIVNDRRADMLARQLAAAPLPLAERLRLRGSLVVELINSARVDEALSALRALEDDARSEDAEGGRRYRTSARMLEVLAYLRMAEEQNCHLTHNRDACLAPIRGQGIHVKREGSARAVQALEEVLRREPDNLRARWLLNIAHMTLGSYPAGVPERHRIPPRAFAADFPLPRFENVAREAGLDLYGLSGGAILDDVDGDGRLDLMVSAIGFHDQMRLFHNQGDGTFADRTDRAGLTGEVGGLNLVQADYNNDGFADALVLRGGWLGSQGRFPLSLLRNDGQGTFTDVTREAGMLRFAPTQTATWLDYDGDGWLDLFVGNESTPGNEHPCELYHNNRDGTFTNVARDAGVDVVGFVKAVVSGDFDNDGRPDLYVSVFGGDNLLFRNDGPAGGPPGRAWRFTDVAPTAGVTAPRSSFGAFFFDYDNDGWLDLFVAGYGRKSADGLPVVEDVAADYLGLPNDGETGRLYRNEGGTFKDVTAVAGLARVVPAMGLNFGDLDNDGWLDFYAGTGTPDLGMLIPNRMFRNAGGRTFQDVTTAGNFGHLQKGHAICFGDVDNDGDQDIFEEMGGAYFADKAWSALFENPGNDNAWLGLELEGVRSNRKAMGARIKVVVGGMAGPRSIYRTVGSGGSFGASPLRQEIGLGAAQTVERVEVFWPATGETQKVGGLKPRRRYHVREGSPEAKEVDWPRSTVAPRAKARRAASSRRGASY